MTTKKDICIGILCETKTPPDRRVLFTPKIAKEFKNRYPEIKILIQKSKIRCFEDVEYTKLGLEVVDDISMCNVLLGVKEVHIPELIPNKQYHFFSHTHKKQSYNRPLLQKMIDEKITMVDHECLTYDNGARVVAFGRWAGIVGAYNGLIAIGKLLGTFELKRAKDCFDLNDMLTQVKNAILPPNYKILVTGKGRVGGGAMETLAPLGLKIVSADDFINKEFDEPVVCQIDADDYVQHKEGKWINFPHFFSNPEEYNSSFKPYSKVADLWVPCHFWDQNSPKFLSKEDYLDDDFRIKVIADVSCDIADPIPSTLRPSTIAEPFYGYSPKTGNEADAFVDGNISIMAVDNLPGELPRDASEDFSGVFLEEIIPAILGNDEKGIVERATICSNGALTSHYKYLQDYLEGKE